jgi:hypothetical protein
MAWTRVNDYGPTVADSDIESLQDTVDVQRRTYDAVTLNNWTSGDTSAPTIAVGSVIEINGSVFEVQTSAITIGSVPGGATDDLYIKLTVTGGTTVTADWSTTAPTWDAAKGGWFDGTNKVLPFVVDYDGSTTWDNKREIVSRFNENSYNYPDGGTDSIDAHLVKTVFQIGAWDMDATIVITVNHSIPDITKIRSVSAMIFNDAGTFILPLDSFNSSTGTMQGGVTDISATQVRLTRLAGGSFDSTSYNDAVINRGYITVEYEV